MGKAWKMNGLENKFSLFAQDIIFQQENYFTPLKFVSKIFWTLNMS